MYHFIVTAVHSRSCLDSVLFLLAKKLGKMLYNINYNILILLAIFLPVAAHGQKC